MKKLTFVILKICLSLNKPFGHSTPHIGKGRILDNYVIKSNKCNQCAFASSYAGNLRQHLKTHSGEKSNKCNQCEYASSYASALKAHLKMHSGEKPNKCNLCDYASAHASNLRTHLKTHSGKSQTNATNANMHALLQAIWGHIYEKTQWWKAEQMRPIWLCILLRKCFEDAFENAQWRKAEQM